MLGGGEACLFWEVTKGEHGLIVEFGKERGERIITLRKANTSTAQG